MNFSPPYPVRAPRAHLADITPVALRTGNERSSARLEVISLTGGLLSMTPLMHQGTRVRMMFVTPSGAVMAGAELLPPVNWTHQPFRFLELSETDQRRLRTTIHNTVHSTDEQVWIEKYRAAVSQQKPSRKRYLKTILAALTASALCLGSALYMLNIHRLK